MALAEHAHPLPASLVLEGQIEPLSAADRLALAAAVQALETTSLVARLSSMAGAQIDLASRFVPARFARIGRHASTLALRAALHTALQSLHKTPGPPSRRLHKALAAASGVVGGAFGLAGLMFELPVSTTLMLRSIADIARAEGEDLSKPESALACLEVFALGGRPTTAGTIESGYFAVRGLLAQSVSEAARFVVQHHIIDEAAPVLARLIAQIAGRFGFVVSQKMAAQAVPVVGAMSGAALNLAFTDHFQKLAHGHFTVRRLERHYGRAVVREEYDRLMQKD